MNIDPKIQLTTNDAQSEAVQSARTADRQVSASDKAAKTAPASGEDTVSLSSTHHEVQSLTASLSGGPEVRSDLVNNLRTQIQQGQYQPSSQKVADAIAREHGKLDVTA